MQPVLALRRTVRQLPGAVASYSTWLLVPAVMLAVLLPQVHGGAASPLTLRTGVLPGGLSVFDASPASPSGATAGSGLLPWAAGKDFHCDC
jgi:hypothetical protein